MADGNSNVKSPKLVVLVIDDEPANLAVLVKILSEQFTIYTGKNGASAFSLAKERKPDLILLDILLPDIDGFSVLARLKEDGQTMNIPVIFITGLTTPEDEEKGFTLGAVDYITKPFKAVVVKSRVNTHLRNAQRLAVTEADLSRLYSLTEDSPNLAIFFGESGRIEYISSAVESMTGFHRDIFYEKGLAPVLGDKEWRNFQDEYLPATVVRRNLKFDLPIHRKDGSQRWFTVSAFSLTLPNGVSGVGMTARDDTDAEILYRELLTAKRKLEIALQAEKDYSRKKAAFLDRMSHEIRTPLNVIIGMSDAAKVATGEKRAIYLDRVTSSAYSLLYIIDQMMDMSQIDMKVFALIPHPCDLQVLLSSLREGTALRAAGAGLTFVMEIGENMPRYVVADERRLLQCLHILLNNAINNTHPGGKVLLAAKLREQSSEDYFIEFQVSDTGVGIPADMLERIFSAFDTSNDSYTTRGIGLGLAIARPIAKMFGGNLKAESQIDQGTKMFFTVRLQRCNQEAEQAVATQPHPLQSRCFLVIDDVAVNREVLAIILESNGCTVDEAENGEQGLEKILNANNRYDAVLMDLHMPKMDGIEMAQRVRASSLMNAKDIPLIAISADISSEVIGRCLDAGINAYLRKPVERKELVSTLEKFIVSQ